MLINLKKPDRRHVVVYLIFVTFFITTFFSPWPSGRQISFHISSPAAESPRWLITIFSGPADASRREVIRSTWTARYLNPAYEYRFVVGRYRGLPVADDIENENRTHGDIWCLEDFINENYHTANRIKNLKLFQFMASQQEEGALPRYDFVSKVDADNWFNIPPYYDTFIAPRLPGGKKYDADAMTVIGRPMVWGSPYAYASGRMYTVSWPMLKFLSDKYTANSTIDLTEDKLMGWYLYEETVPHEFVVVELEQAWDIGLECLVNNQTDTMLIHSIKDDHRIAEIGSLFDDRGRWNGKILNGLTNFNRTTKEVLDRVGQPTTEELQKLQEEWESGIEKEPMETLDWKLIQDKISVENRQKMGEMYPLNLPGNNASTGVVPQVLKPLTEDEMSG